MRTPDPAVEANPQHVKPNGVDSTKQGGIACHEARHPALGDLSQADLPQRQNAWEVDEGNPKTEPQREFHPVVTKSEFLEAVAGKKPRAMPHPQGLKNTV